MIVKKVANPNKSASKAVRIRALARYIRAPETESETEKCLYAGTRGFLCDAPEVQTEEMLALARDAPRSRDPIAHWVLSWHADEHPTPAQVEELVDLLLDELDVAGHQAIFGLHADTDNTHLHVMLNRVHPDTLKAVEINGGFDIKALHRACARIEHAQGWRAERGARYRVNEANAIEPVARVAAKRMARPPQLRVDVERRRGERSAARIAIEEAAPLIEAAQSWEALHEALGARDMGYVRAGSGAAVRVGEVFVKASTVSRGATLRRLEDKKRLGPYTAAAAADASREPRPERDEENAQARDEPLPDPGAARPLIEAARSWDALHEALAAQGLRYVRKGSGARIVAGEGEAAVSVKASTVSRRAALRPLEARLGAFEPPGGAQDLPEAADPGERQAALEGQQAAWARWEAQCEEEVRALAERQRAERDALRRDRCWKGRLLERNLHRRLLADAHAREKAALREAHRRAREALRAPDRQGQGQAPWRDAPALAFLRRTRHLEPGALEAASGEAPSAEALAPRTIGDYQGRALGSWVVYATRAQHARGEVAFVDRGRRVTVHERDSDAAALAAMRLAAQKWGRFRARGSEAHKRRSAWLAAKHHLPLANPELQGLIAQYRRELGRDRAPPRLGRRPRAAMVVPPPGPAAAPQLRAPPERPAPPRAAVGRPPQGPRIAAGVESPPRTPPRSSRPRPPPPAPHVQVKREAPPRLPPRSPSTPVRPPAAPRLEGRLEPPARLVQGAGVALPGPPATPRVKAALGAPPGLPQRVSVAAMEPPRSVLAEATLATPPRVVPRSPPTPAHPPAAPRLGGKLEVPARLVRRAPFAWQRPPPATPRVEAALGAPPGLPQRVSAAVMEPPRSVLAEATLATPPRAAPRSPSTPARPPAAPRLEGRFEPPARLVQGAGVALPGPPATPRVKAALGAPPGLPQRVSAAAMEPPRSVLAEATLATPPRVAPRSPPTPAHPPAAPRLGGKLEVPARLVRRAPFAWQRPPPATPRVEAALGAPPALPQRVSVAVMEPPRSVLAEATLATPPRAAPHGPGVLPTPPKVPRAVTIAPPSRVVARTRPGTAPIGPPRAPKIEYELAEAYGVEAALEAIELARRHEVLEAQYGELRTLIEPGKVTLLDPQNEPRYTGAHTLTTAARAWACRLRDPIDRLPELESAIERAVWPDLFETLDIEHRLIARGSLPELAKRLQYAVDGRVTWHLSNDYRGEGDSRSPGQWLRDHLAEPLRPRPQGGWGRHDIPASASAQARLDRDNASPVRDSKSASRVAGAVACVVTAIAQRHYGPQGKPPGQPPAVPSEEEFRGWRQATRAARHQAALAAHAAEGKARERVVSGAVADWRAEARELFKRLAEEVQHIENAYWHTRKTRDEEEKKKRLRERRHQYNQTARQRKSVRGHSSAAAGYG